MTPSDLEQAAASFVERVQIVGTASALDEIRDAVRAQQAEELARYFAARPGTWTGTEVADCLRRWRFR